VSTALSTATIPESITEVFPPFEPSSLGSLFAEHEEMAAKLTRLSEQASDPEVIEYFVKANARNGYVNTSDLFKLETARRELDAAYWRKALAMTDVLSTMPAKLRTEWNDSLDSSEAPPFDPETVIATMRDLLVRRAEFFTMRVEGVFDALSDQHVTNSPQGFRKRMIIQGVRIEFFSSDHKVTVINDLRTVIGRFLGRRGDMTHGVTSSMLKNAYRYHRGQWVDVDGGAFKIRVYKNGNAHIEVHPEMAWRLNQILASRHPNAIAESARRRPRRTAKAKDFDLFTNPLPWKVVDLLSKARVEPTVEWHSCVTFSYCDRDSLAMAKAEDVLVSLGGVKRSHSGFFFDYEVGEALAGVICSGRVPDKVAHQFYPTPEDMAQRVIDAAAIGDGHRVLEPSAGMGALACRVPEGAYLRAVEVSELHCDVLRSKGVDVERDDFLKMSGETFDRIVMNPPFSKGRWQMHLYHAMSMTKPGGRIAAVLPASAKNMAVPEGWTCQFGEPEAFPGTSINVVVAVFVRAIQH